MSMAGRCIACRWQADLRPPQHALTWCGRSLNSSPTGGRASSSGAVKKNVCSAILPLAPAKKHQRNARLHEDLTLSAAERAVVGGGGSPPTLAPRASSSVQTPSCPHAWWLAAARGAHAAELRATPTRSKVAVHSKRSLSLSYEMVCRLCMPLKRTNGPPASPAQILPAIAAPCRSTCRRSLIALLSSSPPDQAPPR